MGPAPLRGSATLRRAACADTGRTSGIIHGTRCTVHLVLPPGSRAYDSTGTFNNGLSGSAMIAGSEGEDVEK